METKEVTEQNPDTTSIPKSRYLPEAIKLPSYMKVPENFADKTDTVDMAIKWVKSYKDSFESQDQRSTFIDNMDLYDELYRAAADRTQLNTTEAENVEDTGSKVKSSVFNSDIRNVTASDRSTILGDEEQIPVALEPIPGCEQYREDEALMLAKYWNMLLAYNWEKAECRQKAFSYLLGVNKYANYVMTAEWAFEKDKRTEREPIFRSKVVEKVMGMFKKDEEDKVRKPLKYKWTEKEYTVKDWMDFRLFDIKDVLFDCMIPEIQDQNCVIFRRQMQYSDLASLKKNSGFLNVDKITLDHRFKGEGTGSDEAALEARQVNAGEDGDANSPSNLYDVYKGYIRVPIDDESGKWSTDSEIPHWYQFAIVGDLNTKPVCVELRKLPYKSKQIPVWLGHSHEDDKGAIHLGYGDLVKSIIAQEMTTTDQAFDNVRLRNKKPWIAERGSVAIAGKTFASGGNQVFWKTPGAQDPHEIDVQDTTQVCMMMKDQLQAQRLKAMDLNLQRMGSPMGSRTSSSEAIAAYEQALKPAMEDAKYKAQFLYFMAFWIKEGWEQFGDPDRSIFINYEGKPVELKPSYVWGDMNIRITSIKRFKDSALRRREEDQLVSTIIPQMLQTQAMDAQGAKVLYTQILTNRGFDNVDKIIRTGDDFDARHVARAENMSIIWDGVYDMPKQEENHAAHLEEHKPYLSTVVLLPDNEKPQAENLQRMKMHVQMHENMSQAKSLPAAPQEGQEAPEGTPGEQMGDMLGAQGGMDGNLPIMGEQRGAGRPAGIEAVMAQQA